jgi:hypothetical protein
MELLYIEGNRIIPGVYLSLQDEQRTYWATDETGIWCQWWRLELTVSYPKTNRLCSMRRKLEWLYWFGDI